MELYRKAKSYGGSRSHLALLWCPAQPCSKTSKWNAMKMIVAVELAHWIEGGRVPMIAPRIGPTQWKKSLVEQGPVQFHVNLVMFWHHGLHSLQMQEIRLPTLTS